MQRGCTERFEGRLAFDARLRSNPRLCGRFLLDLYTLGLITVGSAKAPVAPVVVPKKDGHQRFIKSPFCAAIIHTAGRQSEFVVTSLATGHITLQGPGGHRVLLLSVAVAAGWDSFLASPQVRESTCRAALRVVSPRRTMWWNFIYRWYRWPGTGQVCSADVRTPLTG